MMVATALLDYLDGETSYVSIHQHTADCGTAALSYPIGDEAQPVCCALTISNYRIIIRSLGDNNNNDSSGCGSGESFEFSLPLMSIKSWSLPRVTMTAAHRAVLQRGRAESLPEHDVARCSSNESQGRKLQQQPPPLAESNFRLSVHKLKISSKHLWEVEVLLQDGRVVNTVSILRSICCVSHIKSMPAFELYRKRYEGRPEVGDGNAVNEKGGSVTKQAGNIVLANAVEFGWNLYDPEREMQRQLCRNPKSQAPSASDVSNAGLKRDLRPWFRLTRVKQDHTSYGKSPTYPFVVMVPSAASDELLEDAMSARSRARFPVVSFVHFGTGAVLARSSQPLARSPTLRQDGELCSMFVNSGYHAHNAEPRRDTTAASTPASAFASHPGAGAGHFAFSGSRMVPPPSLFDTEPEEPFEEPSAAMPQEGLRRQRTLLVADCRPHRTAYANRSLGGGYEGGFTHDFCEVKFHGIENIHSVAKSFTKLKVLVQQFNGREPKEDFLLQLHETGWLQHIQRVLLCSNAIAEALDRGDSCLVHCTDGWDRTPQCTATAMLLLDPFYRTIIGFSVLVEKEFCSFGHKFAERCGHQVSGDTCYTSDKGVSDSDTDAQSSASKQQQLQPSPIFVLWIDVVFQVVRQFPRHFEFTPEFLEYLSEEVYACVHGTFLCNGEKERMFEGVRLNTGSVWTDVLRATTRERSGTSPLCFLNNTYDSSAAWEYISKQRGCGIQRILPNCSSKRVVFWESFYLRHDGDTHSMGLRDGSQRVQERVVFHKDWQCYFEEFVEESCVARRREILEMQLLLKNLNVSRPQVTTSSTPAQGDSNTCRQCHKSLGMLGMFSRERCRGCRSVICSDCMVDLGKGVKMCRSCYNEYEWNNQ